MDKPSTKAPTTVDLGTAEDVVAFWTFPNNVSGVRYFPDQTVENTVQIYIEDSIARDGVDVQFVGVRLDRGSYLLDLDGSDAEAYRTDIEEFISAGKLALETSRVVNLDGRWDAVWRFMLPVGLALKNNQSVELLHFPPEYVLERDRDYLLANTLIRWGECLLLHGADPSKLDQYQTTIDIAPIGADSGAGSDIEAALGDYSEYTPYISQLITNWTGSDLGIKPLVTFGSPARRWLHDNFFPDDEYFSVLDAGYVNINGTQVPFAIANHPSYFYNAIESDVVPPENYELLFGIMRQDLIVARWQVTTSSNPALDPVAEMLNCTEYYDSVDGQRQICIQLYMQGFDLTEEESGARCIIPTHMSKLERKSLDGRLAELSARLRTIEGRDTPALVRFADKIKAKRGLKKR